MSELIKIRKRFFASRVGAKIKDAIHCFQWRKKMLKKMWPALWDDTIGYCFRCVGIGKKFKRLRKLKDKFKGERCFIALTGPSMTVEDLELLKEEHVFCVNAIVKVLDQISYKPEFYVIQDGHAYEALRKEIVRSDFQYAFIGNWKMKKEFFTDKDWISYPIHVLDYFFSWPEGNYETNRFSDDAFKRVFGGVNVAYGALQLAVYLGFKKVYLLGADCTEEGRVKNFADVRTDKEIIEENENCNKYIESYMTAYQWEKEKDVQIFNATRGGKLEVFPRVNLEDVLLLNTSEGADNGRFNA